VVYITYQERIRSLREDADFNQDKIAEMLGAAQTTYSQYELSKHPLPIDYLIALCKFYNVSADYILCFTNTQNLYSKK